MIPVISRKRDWLSRKEFVADRIRVIRATLETADPGAACSPERLAYDDLLLRLAQFEDEATRGHYLEAAS